MEMKIVLRKFLSEIFEEHGCVVNVEHPNFLVVSIDKKRIKLNIDDLYDKIFVKQETTIKESLDNVLQKLI